MKSVAVVAVVAVLVGAVTGCTVDRYDLAYDDVFDARAQDAVDRGWVPEWLPESAVDLRVAFDPDNDSSILTAELVGGDVSAFDDACRTTEDPVTAPSVTADWFPVDVTELDPVRACNDERFAVRDGAVLHAWTPPGVAPTVPE